MRRVTSSPDGLLVGTSVVEPLVVEPSTSGRLTISPRVKSASFSFAATRSRSDLAAIPANWSPDFSSLALANSSRRSEKSKRSIMGHSFTGRPLRAARSEPLGKLGTDFHCAKDLLQDDNQAAGMQRMSRD